MRTPAALRKAFTLVEMLVVIAILAILISALFPKLLQIQENGWATRCKANLKNLYQATLNFENDKNQDIPYAGSYEVRDVAGRYWERPGWVRWTGSGTWPNTSPQAGSMTQPQWYGANAMISITNGTLWEYTGNQASTYLCPTCGKKYRGYSPCRSYVMNEFFYSTDNSSWWPRNLQTNMGNREPSRLPLFCDGCFTNSGGQVDNTKNDGHVHLANGNFSGFMYGHKIGGALRCQIVYLDGHVSATNVLTQTAFSGDE